MAGTLRALILRSPEQSPSRGRLPVVPLVPGSGLALLPLTDEIVARLEMTSDGDAPVAGFYELTSGVAEWARRSSRHGVVGYVHTEFFGGGGFHEAMAWRDGAVTWGPLFTATSAGEGEEHHDVVADRRDMAGNALLRWLGVRRTTRDDEFAAAGLTRYRWTDEWAELVSR